MRVLLLALSVLFFLGGCATSSPKASKKKTPSIVNVRGERVGADVQFYNRGHLKRLEKAQYAAFGKEMKSLIDSLNITYKYKKSGKIVSSTRKFDNKRVNYKHKNIVVSRFAYNAKNNYYALAGRFKFYDKVAKINRYFPFVLKTSQNSKFPEGFFFGPATVQFGTIEYMSSHGNLVVLGPKYRLRVVNLDKKQARKIPKTKYALAPVSGAIKASKNARYVAFKLEEKKGSRVGIALFDSHTGKIIKTFDFSLNSNKKSRSKVLAFDFSDDNRYFIYKDPSKNFQIYDLAQKKVIDSFGRDRSWATNSNVTVVENLVLASFSGRYDESIEKKAFIYDTQTNSTLCDLDTTFSESGYYWKGKKSLQYLYAASHKVYSLAKDACVEVQSNFLEDIKMSMTSRFFLKDDGYYSFDQGEIKKYLTFKDVDIDPKKIAISKSLENPKRLLSAGFDKKAFEELNKLLKEDMDYFEKYYAMVRDTLFTKRNLKYAQEAYFNALALQEYIRQGKVKDNAEFERAAKNYAWFAALMGFKEVLPSFIKTYEDAIGSNPTAMQKDMLAIYQAMYLLEINKDDEAYELLFAANPIAKEAQENVVKMSIFDSSLFKDRKKTAVALGMKIDDFKDSLGKFYFKGEAVSAHFYDLNGNKIKYGETPEALHVKPKKSNEAKSEAIELLE